MLKKRKKIWLQKYNRINYANCEVKLMLLKSVIRNRNIKFNLRSFAYSKLIRNENRYNYKGYKQTCLITGKSRGVWSFCNLSRHKFNDMNRSSHLVGLKSMSW